MAKRVRTGIVPVARFVASSSFHCELILSANRFDETKIDDSTQIRIRENADMRHLMIVIYTIDCFSRVQTTR